MTTHDPLGPEHITLLNQLSAGPIELSQKDRLFTERGQALGFLIVAGYAKDRVLHAAADAGLSTIEVSRTDKAYP